MPLSKKPKTPIKMKILDKKKWRPRFLKYAERHVFRLSKITVFEGVFVLFCFYEGTPYFGCITANDFRWNEAVK